jgi:hypothetical protein
LKNESSVTENLTADEVSVVSDQRFTWKGREKLVVKSGHHKFDPGYQLVSYVQISPPAAATATDLRPDWRLFAVGTSYGFFLYDYSSRQCIVNRCTLNVQDFAIVSGDFGAMSRKKSFRKSLRESFRRLRRGRSQRNQPVSVASASSPDSTTTAGDQPTGPRKAFSRTTTAGIRTLNAPTNDTAQQAAAAHRNLLSGERQVEPKVELSSIVRCITLTSAVITNNLNLFKPSLWVGTNSGQVLVYAIDLASEHEQQSGGETDASGGNVAAQARQDGPNSATEPTKTTARLTKEIQLKHKAPIVAIFTTPEAPQAPHQATSLVSQNSVHDSSKSTPEKGTSSLFERQTSSEQKSITNESESNETSTASQQRTTTPATDKSPSKSVSSKDHQQQQQPRVLICSEEQFKVFNLPNLKPFCKFKLTAHEGLRAKKISITQFLRPASAQNTGNTTMVTMASSSSASKLQSTTTLNSSKSLQSFATQTSPSASPVPLASSSMDGTNDEPQRANGAGNKSSSTASGTKQTAESNNNSLLASNNNKQQQDKELLNAKFGAKASSTPSAVATTSATTDMKLDDQTQPADGAIFEPYMVCMSNQGDCAIYSVPDLKRQAQIQVCKREDINGITSAMLTNYGEGYYLRSSSNFLRFSISSQRVLRVLSVV